MIIGFTPPLNPLKPMVDTNGVCPLLPLSPIVDTKRTHSLQTLNSALSIERLPLSNETTPVLDTSVEKMSESKADETSVSRAQKHNEGSRIHRRLATSLRSSKIPTRKIKGRYTDVCVLSMS